VVDWKQRAPGPQPASVFGASHGALARVAHMPCKQIAA
jgi:hypothetical protein